MMRIESVRPATPLERPAAPAGAADPRDCAGSRRLREQDPELHEYVRELVR